MKKKIKRKKKKKKKEKLVYLDKNQYSKLFESFYNNKTFSDFTIKIEGKEETVPVHKIVLTTQSQVFSEHVKNSNEYTFSNTHSTELVHCLLKFLYTGSLEVSNKENVFCFILLAKKLKINLNSLKIPPKTYLNGLLDYVEKDVENRSKEVDHLIEDCDFKKLDIEYVQKLFKKRIFTKIFNIHE